MSRVLIVNCLNSDNFGDQEIGNQISNLLTTTNHFFNIFDIALRERLYYYFKKPKYQSSHHLKKQSIILLNFKKKLAFLKWRYKNKKIIKAIVSRKYDYLIFGGGELIQSNYLFPNMIKLWTKLFLKRNPHSKICFFAVGVTASFSDADRHCFNHIFKKTDLFFVRDKSSVLNLKNVYNVDSRLVPDVVYALEKEKEKRVEDLAIYGVTSISRILRYGFNGFKTINDYFEYSYKDLLNKYIKRNIRVVLFYEDILDRQSCELFAEFVHNEKGRELDIAGYETVEGFKEFILCSKYVSSPRMHACILGLLYHKKVDVIEISPKLKSFKKNYIDSNPPNKDTFKESLLRVIDESAN